MEKSHLQDFDSRIPAIQLLLGIGWHYLSREEAFRLRDFREDQVVLNGILQPWLAENNRFRAKGKTHKFSDINIHEAVRRLSDKRHDGLACANQRLYQLLTLGTSLEQSVDGDRKGRSLQYIDWQNPHNNIFHVSDNFSTTSGHLSRRQQLDLVLFVNGIPFVAIECCSSNHHASDDEKPLRSTLQRLIEMQQNNEIPELFQYLHMMIVSDGAHALYSTVNTPAEFWSQWWEEEADEEQIEDAANHVISKEITEKLCTPFSTETNRVPQQQQDHFKSFRLKHRRAVSGQDRMLWALLRPARLLALVYGYTLFDAGVRKIARYSQYFAVKAVLKKISKLDQGRRHGGVIWHTTGCGKSLTMVMLAKALSLVSGIENPRVVLVTDRIDLDKQIYATFAACGKAVVRASTGEQLVRLIKEGKTGVITSVIDKFHTVIAKHNVIDPNPDIFVLVDEGHRSNYGNTARKMRRVFPNAAFIGFTGTPLLKKDKNTIQKFGGIIHSYSLYQATVEDHVVLPLMYQGRIANLNLCSENLQADFERITQDLPQVEKAQLIRKVTQRDRLLQGEQRIRLIATDISQHYQQNFQGSGLKAQLATSNRESALLYRHFINKIGLLTCEVIMSQPGPVKDDENQTASASYFWQEMMSRYGSERAYLDAVLGSFSREDGIDILIVVDKLLTGFDEPRNTVLYIDKPLKGHTILQAIARVNRLFPGKTFGYVVDYRGILGELNQTMHNYTSLLEYDSSDVQLNGVLFDTQIEVKKLSQLHVEIWQLFDDAVDRNDPQSLALSLQTEDRRDRFYHTFSRFQRALSVALTTAHFYRDLSQQRVDLYKQDMSTLLRLRNILRPRHVRKVHESGRETQINSIIERHIQVSGIASVTREVDIFDVAAFDAELAKHESKVAKAELIVGQLKKTLYEKMDQDPVHYENFDQIVQQAVVNYRKGRFDEAEYLNTVSECLRLVQQGHGGSLPPVLEGRKEAQGYFYVLHDIMLQRQQNLKVQDLAAAEDYFDTPTVPMMDAITSMAIGIEELVKNRKIRDWSANQDVLRQIQNDIDDYLYEKRATTGIRFKIEELDMILNRCVSVARKLSVTP